MRLFDFRCNACSHVFEELVEANDEVHCPKCASAGATRQLSAFSIGRSAGGAPSGSSDPGAGGGCFGGGCAGGACGL